MAAEAVFKAEGSIMDYTPVADTPAGTVIIVGVGIGVTMNDIVADELGSLQLQGVFSFATSDAPSIGDQVFWNNTTKEVTVTGPADAEAGIVVSAVVGGRVYVNTRRRT